MCTSVFLNIQQAFDKVWHEAEIKLSQLFLVLKLYLEEQYFQVKTDDTQSDYHLTKAGVPQGSVVWPLLYLIYVADATTRDDTLIATFADHTTILSSDADPARASERLKNGKSRLIRSNLLK
jgi:hypothetical protein